MSATTASLTVFGTELSREGSYPLVALEAYSGGRLVTAVVVDPEMQGVEPVQVQVPRALDRVYNTFRVT